MPAAIGQVWAVVSDPDRAADWFSFAERTDVIAGEGKGQLRRQHGRWGNRRSEIDQEVVEFEPPAVIAWKHTDERLDGQPAPTFAVSTVFRIELVADGERTTVTLRTVQRPASPVKGLLMRAAATREVKRRMAESLARLARAVVSG